MERGLAYRKYQDTKHKDEAKARAKINDYGFQYNNPFYMNGFIWRHGRNLIPDWEDPKAIGINATTPHRCSGMCCCNIRGKAGATRQEVNHFYTTLDELKDMGFDEKVLKKAFVTHGNRWWYD